MSGILFYNLLLYYTIYYTYLEYMLLYYTYLEYEYLNNIATMQVLFRRSTINTKFQAYINGVA